MSDYVSINTTDPLEDVASTVAALVDNPQSGDRGRANELDFMFGGWTGDLLVTLNGNPFVTVNDGLGKRMLKLLADNTDWDLVLEDEQGKTLATVTAAQSA